MCSVIVLQVVYLLHAPHLVLPYDCVDKSSPLLIGYFPYYWCNYWVMIPSLIL